MIRREGAVAGNGPTTGRTRKTITAGTGGGVIMVIAMAMAREEETTAEIPGGRGAGAGVRIVVMKRDTEEMAGGMGAGEDTMIAGVALVPLPVRLAPPPLRDPDRGAATKRATVARKEERMTRGSMTAAAMPETTTTTVPTKGTPATKKWAGEKSGRIAGRLPAPPIVINNNNNNFVIPRLPCISSSSSIVNISNHAVPSNRRTNPEMWFPARSPASRLTGPLWPSILRPATTPMPRRRGGNFGDCATSPRYVPRRKGEWRRSRRWSTLINA